MNARAQTLSIVFSVTIVVGAATLAAQALLSGRPSGRSLAFTVQDQAASIESTPNRAIPVFFATREGQFVRAGVGTAISDRVVVVRGFDDVAAGPSVQSPVLLKCDLGLLWAIASERHKGRIRTSFRAFVEEVRTAVTAFTSSDLFRDKYRGELKVVVRTAVESSLADPDVDLARGRLLALLDKAFDQEFVRQYSSIIARESARAFLRLLGDLRGILTGNIAPELRERLRDVLATPAAQQLVVDRIRAVLGADESMELLLAIGGALTTKLIEDPRILEVLARVASERAFADRFEALERSGVQRFREIATLLLGVDHDDRMHPVAAAILRSLLFNDAHWIVAFGSPEMLGNLRAARPSGVVGLLAERGSR